MNVVLNQSPNDFALSQAAYEHLIRCFAVPVRPASEAGVTGEIEDVVIFDASLDPGTVVSDDPEDVETAVNWVHRDHRYFDLVFGFAVPHVRSLPCLVQTVMTLGPAASGPGARLRIFCVPATTVEIIREASGWEIAIWKDR